MSKVNDIIKDLSKVRVYESSLLVDGILEMGRICFVPSDNKNSEYDMYIHTNDPGKIPHFHVRKIGKKGGNSYEWDKCIRLDQAKYFSHGKHTGQIPSSKIEKEVINTLYKKHPKFNITYWEYAVQLWNDNNSDVEVGNLVMPDYTKGISL
jgi:hypothetical protein